MVVRHSFSHALQQAWDPCEPAPAAAVRSALDSLLTFATPATQEHLFSLVETIAKGLGEAAEEVAVPAWPPSAMVAAPVAAAASAWAWQQAIALLASVSAFQGLLSQKLLAGVVGDRMLHMHLVPAIDACVVDAERHAQARQSSRAPGIVAASLALALQHILQVAAALPPKWLRAKAESGEGVAAVASLKAVAKRAVRLVVGGDTGAAAQKRQEDAELVREQLGLS